MTTWLDALQPDHYHLPADVLESLLTPALVIDMGKIRRNVERTLALTGGDPTRWRPHLKTTKLPASWDLLLDVGVRHFKCATTREAACLLELLERRGVVDADLLVAYPFRDAALERIAALAHAFPATTMSILSEDPEHVASIPESIGVFIDLNPGMHRTGVHADRIDTVEAIARAAGDRFRGLHFYDGHIREPDPVRREAEAIGLYERLMAVRAHLVEAGFRVDELITSGTRTFPIAMRYEGFRSLDHGVHRCSPGTVMLADVNTAWNVPEVEFEAAAIILSRIVSHPTPDIVTCDAGSKAVARDCGDPVAVVAGRPDLEALTPSEEHLPFRCTDPSRVRPERGDLLYLVPRHICPCVNLADEALVIDDDRVLGIQPIAARGHEMVVASPVSSSP